MTEWVGGGGRATQRDRSARGGAQARRRWGDRGRSVQDRGPLGQIPRAVGRFGPRGGRRTGPLTLVHDAEAAVANLGPQLNVAPADAQLVLQLQGPMRQMRLSAVFDQATVGTHAWAG